MTSLLNHFARLKSSSAWRATWVCAIRPRKGRAMSRTGKPGVVRREARNEPSAARTLLEKPVEISGHHLIVEGSTIGTDYAPVCESGMGPVFRPRPNGKKRAPRLPLGQGAQGQFTEAP